MLLLLALLAHAKDDPTDPPVDPPATPSSAVQFTVNEGTWTNLDVSPDGERVAFDLLGHIYTVPLAGGRATALTSGHSWNMHPRFAPDGTSIAFTSDRGGGDNIWVMNADGTDHHAVTEESFRLVSQPDWTPDGRFIYGRKHFTGGRSLGTGEIWAWQASGEGAGHAWTEKGHLEADVNEPHVDPNGEWLYYSSTGPYQYNRNIYQGIYSIKRTHLHTGETQGVAGGPGGAIRPAVSPDGRTLGYLRRTTDGQRTELVLRDLKRGSERVLFDRLDRDQQETWSIHGTYPTWDWMPDGSGVVVAFDGLPHRIDLQGKSTAIPIEVQVDRALVPAVRQPHAASPVTGEAKVVRWASLSPSGDRLLYVALGQVWIQPVGGEAVALTDTDRLSYAPSWAPDGSSVVFTSWTDKDGGMVWHQPVDGVVVRGEAQALGDAPDFYTGPAFSPDGKKVLWVRGNGVSNRSANASHESKLRLQWRTLDSDEVHDAGTIANTAWGVRTPRPRFSADGDRIVTTDKGAEHTELVSTNLAGHDRRVLATGEYAVEIALSPDGSWIAWKAQHRVFVAPMPATGGRAVQLGTKQGSLPTTRLSAQLGEWVAWANDNTLTYTAGPTVYRVSMADGLPSEASAPKTSKSRRNPWPDGTLAAVGEPLKTTVTYTRATSDKTLVLRGARIVTLRGDEVIEDGAIVVRNERIVAIGTSGSVATPSGAEELDVSGKTIVPGLVDVHAHMGYGQADVSPQAIPSYAANLAYGVTTTHDPSAETQFVFGQRELVEAGRVVGPRIFSTGYILYGAEGADKASIESLDDAREHLRRIKTYGGFSVKSYNQPRRDQRQWVLHAAREEGMLVVPEGGSTLAHNLTMIVDGHTGIEHALPVEQLREDVQRLWSANAGVHYTPTLLVGYGGVWGENAFYQRHDVWKKPRLQRWSPPGRLEAKGKRRSMMVPEEDWHHVRLAKTAKALNDRGVHVNLGGHGQLQGLGPHWELWALVEGGFTPHEALRASSLNGATYLGLADDLGSLETGKLADFIVLDANPLKDIQATEQVHRVMKGGVLYNPDTLATEFPTAGPPLDPWWHAATTGGPTLPWVGDAGDGCMD